MDSTTTKSEERKTGARALDDHLPRPGADAKRVRVLIVVGVALVLVAVVGLHLHAASRTNHVALSQAPKPVSVQAARAGTFRPVRTYVGTINAWNTAKVGPQYVSAYIGTVLVRPGAAVRRGEVLATLDCRSSSAASKEVAARARALVERQVAVENEATRVQEMAAGNFASKNEAEQLTAKAASERAEVEGLRASLVSRNLEVDDCILRAPFAGEISERYVDPGAYVRPGNPIVAIIDRSTVRISADSPESDYSVVAPATEVTIEVDSAITKTKGLISRRAPAADESTRTVHFEIDVPNSTRALPVGTTARISINVGQPQVATIVPLRSATVRGDQATVFVVEGGVAKRTSVKVLGELGDSLYTDPKLAASTRVVVEGRALLDDGDHVTSRELQP